MPSYPGARVRALAVLLPLMLGGCALHADVVQLREDVDAMSKNQQQMRKQLDPLAEQLKALETKVDAATKQAGKAAAGGAPAKEVEGLRQEYDDLAVKLRDVENRLARLEEAQPHVPVQPRLPSPEESGGPLPGTPGLTPTSAFNLAYNDYLAGRFELAISGFERLLKDFPATSLAASAYYWIGESRYSLKDSAKAVQAFERVVTDYPRHEKVPPSLYKLGLLAAESGDVAKARGYFKRVLEEFSTSDEARLAKLKLAEIR